MSRLERVLGAIEFGCYCLWKAAGGAAYGLGLEAAEGWVFWFMLTVGAAFVVDRLLTSWRLAKEPRSMPLAVTALGSVHFSGEDAKRVDDIIKAAEKKQKTKAGGLN